MQDALKTETLTPSEASSLPAPGPTSFTSLTPTLAVGAMLIGIMLVAYWVRRKLPGAGADRAKSPLAATAATSPTLAADMEELSERLAGALDAKAERLEHLISTAEDRIRTLEKLHAAPRPAAVPFIEARPERRPSPSGQDASHREIYELADSGLSPVEIAQRVDRPTGQVELILNLRRGSVAL